MSLFSFFRLKVVDYGKVIDLKTFYDKRFLIIVFGQVIWIFINAQTRWTILGFWSRETTLGKDLQFVAASVVCDRNQSFFSGFVASECGNFYGLLLIRILRMVGFGLNNYFFYYLCISTITVLVTSLLFYKYSTNQSIFKNVFWFFTLFGPYYLLLINRGNIDQLIFSALVISWHISSRKSSQLFFISLIVSSLFKFYSLPLLLIYVFFQNRYSYRAWFWAILVTFEIAREIQQIDFAQIRNISSSFGISIFIDYFSRLNEVSSHLAIIFILLITALSFTVAIRSLSNKDSSSKHAMKLYSDSLASILLLQHLFCFIAFLNYDWRLIYLIFFLFVSSHSHSTLLKVRNSISFAFVIAWFGTGFNQIAIFADILLFAFFVKVSVKLIASSVFPNSKFLQRKKFN